MRRTASGNRFAIGLLLCATIWMALRVSGLFRVSPVRFPAWAGFVVAVGILAGPLILTIAQSLHWFIRLVAGALFLGCAFVFPWFYDQLPLYFWLTMLFAYVEVFGVVPLLSRRRRSPDERTHPERRNS
jgi:Zn-dependent protease with chaperone function